MSVTMISLHNGFLGLETAFRHSFLSRELECLPHGDPRNLCENIRIRLLATHSLACISQIRIIAAIIIGEFFFTVFLRFSKVLLIPRRVSCLHHVIVGVGLLNHLKYNQKVIRFCAQGSVKLCLLHVNFLDVNFG